MVLSLPVAHRVALQLLVGNLSDAGSTGLKCATFLIDFI